MGHSKFVLRMDPADKILLKRKMGDNGQAQLFLSKNFADKSLPYVPRLTGALRDSARVNPKSVSWNTPYARRQFYEHKSKSMWHIKMWRDRGKEIVDSVAQFCDCRVKR